MTTTYAEICRVGNLEADFNKFCLLKFSEIFTVLLWNKFKVSKENEKKKIFSDKNPKNHFSIEIAWVRPIFGCKFNFRVHIWKQNTETEKTNGFW